MKHLTAQLRTLALLLRQQVPLVVAVERLARRQPEWTACAQALNAGASWPEGLALVPSLPAEALPLLIAELGSDLAEAVQLTAGMIEARDSQRRRWAGLLIYPSLLLGGAITVLLLVSYLFQTYLVVNFGAGTGALYETICVASAWVMRVAPVLVMLPVVAVLSLRSPRLRSNFIPIASAQLKSDQCLAFLTWLRLALRSHYSFPEAIRVASGAVVIQPLRQQLLQVADQMERGSELEQCLPTLTLWSPTARWLWLQCERQAQSQESLELACQCLGETLRFQSQLLLISLQTGFILYIGGLTLGMLLIVLSPVLALIGSM
ncbi:type II secretion system F family protein [bacterium]|nr:type II secretion system F family protein [bacterium]